jgi:hypothetical protein
MPSQALNSAASQGPSCLYERARCVEVAVRELIANKRLPPFECPAGLYSDSPDRYMIRLYCKHGDEHLVHTAQIHVMNNRTHLLIARSGRWIAGFVNTDAAFDNLNFFITQSLGQPLQRVYDDSMANLDRYHRGQLRIR